MNYNPNLDLYFKTEEIKGKYSLSYHASNVWLIVSGYCLCYEKITLDFLKEHTPYLEETLLECIEEMIEKKYLFNKKLPE